MLDVILDIDMWEKFYQYRTALLKETSFNKRLRKFIDNQQFVEVFPYFQQHTLSVPIKKMVAKKGTDKKRVVYTYRQDENIVLKFLTWYILRRYDYLFTDNLYSFRPNINAKTAIRRLKKQNINSKYFYKTDIHDYFNSIPVDKLLIMLNDVLKDYDDDLYSFLYYILNQPVVYEGNEPIMEQKGIMAGVPLASFLANVYLMDLDRHFADIGVQYARYSDDIIVFADTAEQRDIYMRYIQNFLTNKQLTVNPKKDVIGSPVDTCVFLGFAIDSSNVIDISPVTMQKLKAKMRRKMRALDRWGNRHKVLREERAKKFIEVFNHKLFDRPEETELSWCYWFFPVINTTKSLRVIDEYAQDCIRYLAFGHHTKGRFRIKYAQIKEWGYRRLVDEYISQRRAYYESAVTEEQCVEIEQGGNSAETEETVGMPMTVSSQLFTFSDWFEIPTDDGIFS